MITEPHTQEGLSRAYVQAVAHSAGINLHMDLEFDYGFDGTFRPVIKRGKRRVESGFNLDFQLKCTRKWVVDGDHLKYGLETKTYNDLVTRDPDAPGAILIVMCLPKKKVSLALKSAKPLWY